MARSSALLSLILLTACGAGAQSDIPPAPSPQEQPAVEVPSEITAQGVPTNGTELLRHMHDRYAGSWYRTLIFEQKTTFADGRVETWYEAAVIPGKLRIDIAPLDSMKAIIFRNDTVYQYAGGKLAGSAPLVHPLMVLGFDVYAAPVEETAAKLAALGIDLGTVREATWQGRPTWVVGAAESDSTSSQFWIDRERLVFVRLIETKQNPQKPDAPPVTQETQFNRYEPLGGGWIAPEVVFLANGKRVLLEEYSEVKADPALPPELFSVDAYRRPGWVVAE